MKEFVLFQNVQLQSCRWPHPALHRDQGRSLHDQWGLDEGEEAAQQDGHQPGHQDETSQLRTFGKDLAREKTRQIPRDDEGQCHWVHRALTNQWHLESYRWRKGRDVWPKGHWLRRGCSRRWNRRSWDGEAAAQETHQLWTLQLQLFASDLLCRLFGNILGGVLASLIGCGFFNVCVYTPCYCGRLVFSMNAAFVKW